MVPKVRTLALVFVPWAIKVVKNSKTAPRRFWQKSPHHLTLDVIHLDTSHTGSKIDCACFRHISTSGFREIGHFY